MKLRQLVFNETQNMQCISEIKLAQLFIDQNEGVTSAGFGSTRDVFVTHIQLNEQAILRKTFLLLIFGMNSFSNIKIIGSADRKHYLESIK